MTLLSLDSSAVIKWILQKQGWKAVDRVLRSDQIDGVMAGPALTEVVFRSRQRGNASSAEQIVSTLEAQGLRVVPADEVDLVRAAALLELSTDHPGTPRPPDGERPTLSLGMRSFLPCPNGATVLTGDTYWGWMVDEGLLTLKVHTLD